MNPGLRLLRGVVRAARARAYDLRPRPWGLGYSDRKLSVLQRAVTDEAMLRLFGSNKQLPEGYAIGIDERAVEYPWMFSRLSDAPTELLDAGSILNFDHLLDLDKIRRKKLTILTLAPERLHKRPNVSYLFGDIRNTSLRDGWFDEIVCISTLEHVGMDNTRLYTSDAAFREAVPESFTAAMAEMRRVIKPGGRFLLTVPFGVREDFGWLRQFDRELLTNAIAAFRPTKVEETFFKYTTRGWTLSNANECADARYFDIHSGRNAGDGAAAARAVACVAMTA